MSVVSAKYERWLGPWTSLQPAQWTDQTPSGDPAVCCARCGTIFEINLSTHRVDRVESSPHGLVVPAIKCDDDACGEFGYIRLMNFADEVVR